MAAIRRSGYKRSMSRSLFAVLLLASCAVRKPPSDFVPEPEPRPPEVLTDLSSLGPYVGFAPLSVDDARSLWFGALVYLPSAARLHEDPSARAEVLLTPVDFGVGEIPSSAVSFGEVTVRAPVSVPPELLSDPRLPVLLHARDVNEGAVPAVWTLDGLGDLARPEGASFNALVALSRLPVEDQARIAERLRSDPGSVVIYANHMAVAREASLVPVDSSGADVTRLDSQALNIAGPELLGWDFNVKSCRILAPSPWMDELKAAGMVGHDDALGWTSSFGGKSALVVPVESMEAIDVSRNPNSGY